MKISEIKDKIKTIVLFFVGFLKQINFPGLKNISVYEVVSLFLKGLQNGQLTMRASSISFNLFLGIFPALIFVFTLIPYIPVDNLQIQLMEMLKAIIPSKTYDAVSSTIIDIISRPRGGLLSFGFVFALFVASNGAKALIDGFNQSYHTQETRSEFKTRLISILLVVIISFLVFIGIILIIATSIIYKYIDRTDFINGSKFLYFIVFAKWIILAGLCFFVTSFLYYFGPAKKTKWRKGSAGSILATVLSIMTYIGFNFYVNNFAKYNVLYGSIGTLLIILLWIYINSLVLLLGYELNASIYRAMDKDN